MSGRWEEKQVQINIQARDNLEGGNLHPEVVASAVSLRKGGGSCQLPPFAAVLSIYSRRFISATRFDEQAGIPYSRCGRTNALC